MDPEATEFIPFSSLPGFPIPIPIPPVESPELEIPEPVLEEYFSLYATDPMQCIFAREKRKAILKWTPNPSPALIFNRYCSSSHLGEDEQLHPPHSPRLHLVLQFKFDPTRSITLEVDGCDCPFQDFKKGFDIHLDHYKSGVDPPENQIYVFSKCQCTQRFVITQR